MLSHFIPKSEVQREAGFTMLCWGFLCRSGMHPNLLTQGLKMPCVANDGSEWRHYTSDFSLNERHGKRWLAVTTVNFGLRIYGVQ
jgi:hypothetical protein